MNKTYQNRMNNSMASKLDVIKPFIKEGMRVLDVGSGMSSELHDFITTQGATYVAIDHDKQTINYLTKKDINVYPNIDDAIKHEKPFDLIYMSSIVHELYSSYNPIEFAHLMKQLSLHLKNDSSKLIIRDWMTYDDETWDEFEGITINSNKIDDINAWITNLNKHGITSPFYVNYEVSHDDPYDYQVSFRAQKKDIYELIYHVVWGMDSYSRESREHYMVPHNQLTRILETDCTLVTEDEIVDTSYIQYMSRYFQNAEELVHKYPAKQILIFERNVSPHTVKLMNLLDSI